MLGDSPHAGWEGDSELGFPLDDVPKDAGISVQPQHLAPGKPALSCHGACTLLENETPRQTWPYSSATSMIED